MQRLGNNHHSLRLLNPVSSVELPEWAGRLNAYYWHIRVGGRDKAKRRRYYRYVAKEQLRLAEAGIDQDLIKAVCRYLSRFDKNSGQKVQHLLHTPPKQMKFTFTPLS